MDVLLHDQTGLRISSVVDRMLEKRGAAKAVSFGQPLREAGLTSLDMVNLMLAIEGEFDIFIPQDRMTPENFRCIDSIAALVTELSPAH